MKNSIKLLLVMVLLTFCTANVFALILPSSRRMATGDFSEDVYDTYDYITTRPDMLTTLGGSQLILFPSELVGDVTSLINMINGNPERMFDNKIGFATGSGKFGLGLHFNNDYIKLKESNYSGYPDYGQDTRLSDSDLDGITAESNEIATTTTQSATNFSGHENIDFGAGIGFSFGNIRLGVGYQAFLDNSITENQVVHYRETESFYNATVIQSSTEEDRKFLQKHIDTENQIILNFGIDKTISNPENQSIPIPIKKPKFLLEAKLIIFNDKHINQEQHHKVEDDDPSQLIHASLLNQTITDGELLTGLPNQESTNGSHGYKIQAKPKFYFKLNDKVDLNLQGKFGIGFGINKIDYQKSVYSYIDYRTAVPAKFQDTYSYYRESIQNLRGDGDYLMYGLRLEQIFKPKYFKIGIGLDATVEQESSTLSGSNSTIIKEKYDSTTNGYTLVSTPYFGQSKRLITIENPKSYQTEETKEISSSISLPTGLEFDLASYIKLRLGYTYTYQVTYTKTRLTYTNNSSQIKTTTYYQDPSTPATVVYSPTGTSSIQYDETIISVDDDFQHTISGGFEIILSKKAIMNISGWYILYNGLYSYSVVQIETKIRF